MSPTGVRPIPANMEVFASKIPTSFIVNAKALGTPVRFAILPLTLCPAFSIHMPIRNPGKPKISALLQKESDFFLSYIDRYQVGTY